MSVVIYGDFSSLACYLASHRVDALASVGVRIGWRAVECAPRLPVTGRRLDATDRGKLAGDQAEVTGLLLPEEELPWRMPAIVPKTEAAVSGYAEAYGAGLGEDVRRLLFTAYWVEGADIGDPGVLRRLLAGPILRGHSAAEPLCRSGYAVSMNRGPITTSAWWRIRAWRTDWERRGTGVVPTLVEDGAPPVSGAEVLRWLGKEITWAGTKVNPGLPDPARYPTLAVRPAKQWVSRVGGPWARSWMGR